MGRAPDCSIGDVMKGKVGMDRAYLALGRALADGASGVSRELAAGDAMFGGDEARYFAVGQSALHCIAASLTAVTEPPAPDDSM